ncbi:ABC transporter ATP-binding protein/permease [Gammaproteobacteria bacterium]|nr:ABC transporter ATP-binding protein/permease [Gammaproteobacteria bacterium]
MKVVTINDSFPERLRMTNYHDRLDLDPRLSNRKAIAIFGRSLLYLWPQRLLLTIRLALVTLIFVIGLPLPWFLKIVVDHGVMQLPVQSALLYPFFMDPFLQATANISPLDITFYALVTLALIFGLVGYSGNTVLESNLAEGADVATQSENKVSSGMSSAHGLIGLLDLSVAIRLSQRITHHVRLALFGNMSRLPLTTLQQQRSGDAIFRVLHDTPSIAGICHALTVNPYAMVFSVTLNLWVLFMVYGNTAPELVWVGLSAVLITLFLTSPLANWVRAASQASRSSGSATTNDLEEGLKNVAAIQSLGGGQQEQAKFRDSSKESFKQSLILLLAKSIVIWIADNIHLLFQTLGFWIIFKGIIDGHLTLGDTPVIIRMYSLLYETSMQFGQVWIEQQDNAAAARRVFFMMDRTTENPEGPYTDIPNPGTATGVRFDNVSFSYPDGRIALNNVSFHARPGETIAIAGATGAGKTTLAYMIPKFVRPSSGRVLIDDTDTTNLSTEQLRQRVAYVFQEHQLLTDTVAANLRIANPNATLEDLTVACQKAGALEFITAMPGGFESRIELGGGTLSTGQKQRLSIARALLRRASILILDEPTAALDPATEASLLKAFDETDNNIVIVIAHRPSTVRHADRILFLHDGEIVEEGTHEELMTHTDGHYRRSVEFAADNSISG